MTCMNYLTKGISANCKVNDFHVFFNVNTGSLRYADIANSSAIPSHYLCDSVTAVHVE